MARRLAPTNDDADEGEDIEIKIDLMKYFETLLRQWQWIAVCALGFGILATIFSLLFNYLSPSYRAVALASSAQTVSSVNFGGAITTQSETDLAAAAASGAQALYDRKARLQSYVTLVQNGDVVNQVLAQVGSKLDKNNQTAAALLRNIDANLVANTDTIQISATYKDPVIAAEIANAWAGAYVQKINELYGGSSSSTSFAATEAETTKAKTNYEAAQKTLDAFVSTNKIDEFTRQVQEITAVVASLRGARQDVFNQQVQDRMTRMEKAYTDSRQIGLFLDNAVSMQAAVTGGGEAAARSNALAMTLLKAEIYAAFQGTNIVQVQNLPEALGSTIGNVDTAGMVADLDALITSLKTRQTDLNTQINSLSSDIQNGMNNVVNSSYGGTAIETTIEANEQKIRDLNAEISNETSSQTVLTRERDLAWTTYSALNTKGAEMGVAAQTAGIVVVFSSPAVPPDTKVIRNSSVAVGATGVGLLFGAIIAYAYEFWENYKDRKNEVLLKNVFTYIRGINHKNSKKPIKLPKEI